MKPVVLVEDSLTITTTITISTSHWMGLDFTILPGTIALGLARFSLSAVTWVKKTKLLRLEVLSQQKFSLTLCMASQNFNINFLVIIFFYVLPIYDGMSHVTGQLLNCLYGRISDKKKGQIVQEGNKSPELPIYSSLGSHDQTLSTEISRPHWAKVFY